MIVDYDSETNQFFESGCGCCETAVLATQDQIDKAIKEAVEWLEILKGIIPAEEPIIEDTSSLDKLEDEEVFNYGMLVSAMHDKRYFDKKTAEEAGATPDTCPENIQKLLEQKFGHKWKDETWGADYDLHFGEL